MISGKKTIKFITITALTAVLTLMGASLSSNDIGGSKAEAANKTPETVDLRIIGTTDIHGQLNSTNYEQSVDYSYGGLARVYDLIQGARSEVPDKNSITVDAGDVLYDYTTEYIFSESQTEIQPIYKAMAMMGYDAITLGNHDFDYGYEYIQRQLNGSGLRGITVVSNVTDSKTGEYPFLENMIITRTMETSDGNKVEVKIGIIGQTIPVLTSKTQSYIGILKTEDMVINAQEQAKKLKENGADIVVALSHTGIGPENPELNFKNVAYALTKIPEIDVVVCGHEHNLFPTTDLTSAYFKLPNVDSVTCLMNDKNVIMAGSRGSAIGIVDLTLEVTNTGFDIVDRKSAIRKVTAMNTTENEKIADGFAKWENQLLEYSTEVIAKIETGTVIQNFYGLLGDNLAIQLLNDSKINYAARYINTLGKSYRDYPIIAASTYSSFGATSVEDFVNIHDSITESQLSSIQAYNNYIYVYKVTGKQLKEWLEWSASAYETLSLTASWNDSIMTGLIKTTGLKSLIAEDWLSDWNSFYIFDGIDYVMDPTGQPRYDINGNLISSNHRITSVKYNGTPVADTDVMLLVTNKITQPTDATGDIHLQVVLNGFNRMQSVLSKYLEQISQNGNIAPQLDYNWRVNMPEGNRFIVKAPYYAHSLIEQTSWYQSYLEEKAQYKYYTASYTKEDGDTVGPHIVATPVVTSATATPYSVSVHVTDASKIRILKYMLGDYGVDYSWSVAGRELNSYQAFQVSENATYSIYAEDMNGNKSIYKLVIDNFSDSLLGTPTIVTYTNRKTKISGRAEPNAIIIFEAYTGTFQTTVSKTGTYSYALPTQPSGSEIIVYIKDKVKGIESEHVSVPVKRTGPNQPSINPVLNNAGYITGDTNDDDASVIAISGDTVYVSNQGGRALYEANTEIYNPELEVVETYAGVNEEGFYLILLPPREAGSIINVYNLDHLSRNSRVATATTVDAGPNAPVVYEISNIENTIRGYIPSKTNEIFDIKVVVDHKTYSLKTNKYGVFACQIAEQLHVGDSIVVMSYESSNSSHMSYPVEVTVKDIEDYVKDNSVVLEINDVSDKSNIISGTYEEDSSVLVAITKGSGESFTSTSYVLETDGDGGFEYDLNNKLTSGMKVYVMTRFMDGNILYARKTTVKLGKPDTPTLVKEVTNADKTVKVRTTMDCTVTLTIGADKYKTVESVYEKSSGKYIYTFEIARGYSGAKITISAVNTTSESEILTSEVVKAAPDQPAVNTIKAGDTKITGKVELLDYEISKEKEAAYEHLFVDAAPKVALTQTRIYVQIGTKKYKGTINNSGKFSITVPALKAGKIIQVWGMNKAGRGPLNNVTVVK